MLETSSCFLGVRLFRRFRRPGHPGHGRPLYIPSAQTGGTGHNGIPRRADERGALVFSDLHFLSHEIFQGAHQRHGECYAIRLEMR